KIGASRPAGAERGRLGVRRTPAGRRRRERHTTYPDSNEYSVHVCQRHWVWLALGVAVGLATCAVTVCALLPPAAHRVNSTLATQQAIENGIAAAEVERLIGRVPGNYPNERLVAVFDDGGGGSMMLMDEFGVPRVWTGGEGEIRVWFDERGRVAGAQFVGG